jgi:hypothetical protein
MSQQIPNSHVQGLTLLSKGDGTDESYWGMPQQHGVTSYFPLVLSQTLTMGTSYPPIAIPIPPGQTGTTVLAGVALSGDSRSTGIDLNIQHNGTNIPGLTGIGADYYAPYIWVTPTNTVNVAHMDLFGVNCIYFLAGTQTVILTFITT